MNGLIYRSFENFLRNTYGAELWLRTMEELDEGIESFEPMFEYDATLIQRITLIASEFLDKPREVLLEDFGTYLVAHPSSERVRRLLRFGGVDYKDFLDSLEDLRGRAHLAVPDLELPEVRLEELGKGEFELHCQGADDGAGHVYVGLLRALADDYGALVLIDFDGRHNGVDQISVRLLESDYSEGRGFALTQQAS
ncbi:MAG: heme NO-binding domain-containing protein [Maritimibacter sp.]|jgi:hypothetical protein